MKAGLWRRIQSVLDEALARPASERAAYIREACSGDDQLYREVESLLAVESPVAEAFLEAPTRAVPLGDDRSEIAGRRLGSYQIVEKLGAGGMGVVYRAIDMRLCRQVALKLLPEVFAADPARVARFNQEAKFLASLSHPNVVCIYDVGDHDGSPYVVSELLDGEDLRHRLNSGRLPQSGACEIAACLAGGLAAAHERGIVHRDVKPENVFLTSDGQVKILDFGLAKLAPDKRSEFEAVRNAARRSTSSTSVTRLSTAAGAVVGTVAYMSPEQVRGRRVDHRSDLFSFGLVLYEMLTGRRAFERRSNEETMAAILSDEPAPVTEHGVDVSPFMVRLVRDCLRKEARERYQSARDIYLVLTALSEADEGPVRG